MIIVDNKTYIGDEVRGKCTYKMAAAAAAGAHQELQVEKIRYQIKKIYISEKENKYITLHPQKISKRAL